MCKAYEQHYSLDSDTLHYVNHTKSCLVHFHNEVQVEQCLVRSPIKWPELKT